MRNQMKKRMLPGIFMATAALTGYSRKVEQINDSLHVYAGGDDVIMDYAVSEFQRRYPDIEVVYEGRRIIEDTEAFYGYNQQLSAELMSGSGGRCILHTGLLGYRQADTGGGVCRPERDL